MAKTNLKYRVKNGGTPTGQMHHIDVDNNNDALMYWSRTWVLPTQESENYTANEVVFHEGGLFICQVALPGTAVEPGVGKAEWQLMAPTPGRGGMNMANPTAGASLGAGWNALAYFDTESLTPLGMTLDTANGLFNFQWPGLWQFSLNVFFNHDNSQQGRVTRVRIFNVTDGAGSSGVPIGIGRNVEDTGISATLLVSVAQSAIDDVFRWEIGGGDTVTAVTYDSLSFTALQSGVG